MLFTPSTEQNLKISIKSLQIIAKIAGSLQRRSEIALKITEQIVSKIVVRIALKIVRVNTILELLKQNRFCTACITVHCCIVKLFCVASANAPTIKTALN